MYIVELSLMIPPILLGGVFVSNNMMLGIFLCVAIAMVKHFIAYVEFYSDQEKPVTLYELSHLTLFNADETSDTPESQGTDPQAAAGTIAVPPAQLKMDKRQEQFRQLMEEEQVWRDEDLTSTSLCERMGIGKTTLSSMISQQYGTTLRDIVNGCRIEEAKRYMKKNPRATQEIVAQQCGFKNAQYFNTQFKKIVGGTPAMWLASHVLD